MADILSDPAIANLEYTSAAIRQALDTLQAEKASIEIQLEQAAQRARGKGEYADSDWFGKAKAARKIKGAQIRHLQMRLHQALIDEKAKAARELEERLATGRAIKEKRKQADTERDKAFSRLFMQVARETLPRPLYDQIIAETIKQFEEEVHG